jgi:poly(A) polymerase
VQQKIYPFEQHRLPIEHVDKDALYVMDRLREAGHIAYLVGGSVRDLLLNKTPKDFDISTSAEPEEIKRLFRNCILIGRRFRLAHLRFGKKILEVSTFRSGDNQNEALILRDNEWGSPEEDVLRRDFTINGLFYDSSTQTIIDYVGGFPDLEKKCLRTIGQPYIRFKQDPVRMIRLLKFRARFGFEIDHDAHIALIESRHEIMKSSSTRILEELLRMLESGSAESFFRLMIEYGLMQLMLPALASFMETKEGEEIYSYLQEVDSLLHEKTVDPFDRSLLLACLAFPIFQQRIQKHYVEREKYPHLGEIQNEAFQLVHEIFGSFFHIPRKLKIILVSILTSQFRLTPIEKKKFRHPRIPNDPNFALSLAFLEIRSCLEPGLQKILEEWKQELQSPRQRPKRKRRRRKKKTSSSPESAEGS